MVTCKGSRPASAEQRLKELGIKLPAPPQPFGTYAEAVQTGNLLFLTGMLPTEGRGAKFIGHVGAELDVEAGRKAARLAAKDLVTDEGVNGSHPERAAVVAFRGPILSRELRPAALSSDGRKKSKLLGTFPVYRRL